MRRQCHLVKMKDGTARHKGGKVVVYHLYTHVNKADDPQRIVRRNARKEMDST
jgi:hypothetical protein